MTDVFLMAVKPIKTVEMYYFKIASDFNDGYLVIITYRFSIPSGTPVKSGTDVNLL